MSELYSIDSAGRVVAGAARFSFLGEATVRLEHAPNGVFDDRPTFRALTMPVPQRFSKVEVRNSVLTLEADGLEITYTLGRPFDALSLHVAWAGGSWSPGTSDTENLGSVFTLDHIDRNMIPHGVHPAGCDRTDRLGEVNMMTTIIALGDARQKAPPPYNQKPHQEMFAEFDQAPKELQDIMKGWRRFPPGPVSRAGYYVLDETGMAFFDPQEQWLDLRLRPDYQNLFFFAYGRDYYKAMRLFTRLCGPVPVLPRWAYGPWYSCFQKLTAKDNQRIVHQFDEHGIPVEVLIVDMDWHVNGWCGWDWNRELFSDRASFFKWKEKAGIKVALNLHDEHIMRSDSHFRKICKKLGHPVNVADPAHLNIIHDDQSWVLDYSDRAVWEAARDMCYEPNEKLGVDFWWLDNWEGLQQGFNSVLWKNHLACAHMEKNGKRPLILGRYSGLGSHRYPAYFSGDTASHWEVLRYEVETNLRAGQAGMNYFSHDLGGFSGPTPGTLMPRIDPELYIRWMQMGALAPVMRVHSDHGVREPWEYGEAALRIVREAYQWHARLVPYFYHLAREGYDEGRPVHAPLYFVHPEDEKTYAITDEYYLGDRLLVAPVVTPGGRRRVYLPAGTYYLLATGEKFTGPVEFERVFPIHQIPMFARAGSIVPMQDPAPRVGMRTPDPLVLAIYPGGDDALALYEDDGESEAYKKGSWTRWPLALSSARGAVTVSIGALKGAFAGVREWRSIRLEVFFVEKPKEVTFDGKRLKENKTGPGWRMDAARSCLVVRLPGMPVRVEHGVWIQ